MRVSSRISVNALAGLVWLAAVAGSVAQVVRDGTLGGAAGPLVGPNFQINEIDGQRSGSNLFHSFSQFDLARLQSASFNGSAGLANILSRVTGGGASSINGRIASTVPGANLFLINPDGILFGSNARLDVSGAFTATTADSIGFADGLRFNALPGAEDAVLSAAPVAAFGFSRAVPAGVDFDETFIDTDDGGRLAVVAGDITATDAILGAPAGQLTLVSVGSPGSVAWDFADPLAEPSANGFARMGNVTLTRTQIDGSDRFTGVPNGGGRILVRAGNLVMEGSSIDSNTSGTQDSPCPPKSGRPKLCKKMLSPVKRKVVPSLAVTRKFT